MCLAEPLGHASGPGEPDQRPRRTPRPCRTWWGRRPLLAQPRVAGVAATRPSSRGQPLVDVGEARRRSNCRRPCVAGGLTMLNRSGRVVTAAVGPAHVEQDRVTDRRWRTGTPPLTMNGFHSPYDARSSITAQTWSRGASMSTAAAGSCGTGSAVVGELHREVVVLTLDERITACRSSRFLLLTRSSSPCICTLTPLGPSSRISLPTFLASSVVMPSLRAMLIFDSRPDCRGSPASRIFSELAFDQLLLEDVEDGVGPVVGVGGDLDGLLAGPLDLGAGALEVVALGDLPRRLATGRCRPPGGRSC